MLPIKAISNSYIFAFLFTLFVEALTVFVVTKKWRAVAVSFSCNLLTHPWAYYLYHYRNLYLYLIEGIVILVESCLWFILYKKNFRESLSVSFITNISSMGLGYVYFYFVLTSIEARIL